MCAILNSSYWSRILCSFCSIFSIAFILRLHYSHTVGFIVYEVILMHDVKGISVIIQKIPACLMTRFRKGDYKEVVDLINQFQKLHTSRPKCFIKSLIQVNQPINIRSSNLLNKGFPFIGHKLVRLPFKGLYQLCCALQ